MVTSTTIKEEWARFREQAVKFSPTPQQETALRQTFYAGAFAFYFLFDSILNNSHLTDKEKCEAIDVLGAESITLAVNEIAGK